MPADDARPGFTAKVRDLWNRALLSPPAWLCAAVPAIVGAIYVNERRDNWMDARPVGQEPTASGPDAALGGVFLSSMCLLLVAVLVILLIYAMRFVAGLDGRKDITDRVIYAFLLIFAIGSLFWISHITYSAQAVRTHLTLALASTQNLDDWRRQIREIERVPVGQLDEAKCQERKSLYEQVRIREAEIGAATLEACAVISSWEIPRYFLVRSLGENSRIPPAVSLWLPNPIPPAEEVRRICSAGQGPGGVQPTPKTANGTARIGAPALTEDSQAAVAEPEPPAAGLNLWPAVDGSKGCVADNSQSWAVDSLALEDVKRIRTSLVWAADRAIYMVVNLIGPLGFAAIGSSFWLLQGRYLAPRRQGRATDADQPRSDQELEQELEQRAQKGPGQIAFYLVVGALSGVFVGWFVSPGSIAIPVSSTSVGSQLVVTQTQAPVAAYVLALIAGYNVRLLYIALQATGAAIQRALTATPAPGNSPPNPPNPPSPARQPRDAGT